MKLALVGAGGHGKVLFDTALECGYRDVHFYDDRVMRSASPIHDFQVLGKTRDLAGRFHEYDGILVAIGNNLTRLKIFEALENLGAPLVSLVHPSAVISPHADIANGTVILANTVVQFGVRLGKCCVVNTSASVDHDCIVGAGVHIAPGVRLTGGVTVGDLSLLGAGCIVLPNVSIGRQVTVGAGSVVLADVSDHVTVVGNPASPAKGQN